MKYFWLGFLGHICLDSLYQDYLGKSEYLRLVDERWMDSGITVPLALVLLVLVIWGAIDGT